MPVLSALACRPEGETTCQPRARPVSSPLWNSAPKGKQHASPGQRPVSSPLWNSAPKGKQHASPGQRPGKRGIQERECPVRAYKSRLLRARSPPKNRILYRTFSARAWLLDVVPGRCPGPICDCPFGATTQKAQHQKARAWARMLGLPNSPRLTLSAPACVRPAQRDPAGGLAPTSAFSQLKIGKRALAGEAAQPAFHLRFVVQRDCSSSLVRFEVTTMPRSDR